MRSLHYADVLLRGKSICSVFVFNKNREDPEFFLCCVGIGVVSKFLQNLFPNNKNLQF